MLSVKDKMTLELEATRFKYQSAKEAAIRETFDESATRFYQRLSRILEDPTATAYDAVLVRSLQRLRDLREVQRSARQLTS